MKFLTVVATWLFSATLALAGPISTYPTVPLPVQPSDKIVGTRGTVQYNFTPDSLSSYALPELRADRFPGASVGAQIDAACASLAGAQGFVIIPASMGAGNSLAGLPQGCIVDDQRGLSAPAFSTDSTGYKGFNVLRNRFTAATTPPVNLGTEYVYTNPFSGGVNTTAAKTNYGSLWGVMDAQTSGQHIGVIGYAVNTANGDTVALDGNAISWGNTNAGGDEGTEGITAFVSQGTSVMTGTVSGISGTRVSYTGVANETTEGEGRPLINTNPSKVYSVGNIASISGTPSIVVGDGSGGQNFTSIEGTGAVTDLWFEIDSQSEVVGGQTLMEVVPIASITDATHLVLGAVGEGLAIALPGTPYLLPSTYKIFKGSVVTSLVQGGGAINVTSAALFANGDTVQQPLGYSMFYVAGHFAINPILPTGSAAGLAVDNIGNQPGTIGLGFGGDWTTGIEFSQHIDTYGIFFGAGAPTLIYDPDTTAGTTALFRTTNTSGALRSLLWDKTNDRYQLPGNQYFSATDSRIGQGSAPIAGVEYFMQYSGVTTNGLVINDSSTPNAFVPMLTLNVGGVPQYSHYNLLDVFNNGDVLEGFSGNLSGLTFTLSAADGTFAPKIYTVATLPTCNSAAKGKQSQVSDATAPTYLGTLTGGSTVLTPVVCNGAAWVSY